MLAQDCPENAEVCLKTCNIGTDRAVLDIAIGPDVEMCADAPDCSDCPACPYPGLTDQAGNEQAPPFFILYTEWEVCTDYFTAVQAAFGLQSGIAGNILLVLGFTAYFKQHKVIMQLQDAAAAGEQKV